MASTSSFNKNSSLRTTTASLIPGVGIPEGFSLVKPVNTYFVNDDVSDSTVTKSKSNRLRKLQNSVISFVLRCPKGFDVSILNGANILLSSFEHAATLPGGKLRLTLTEDYDLELNGAPEVQEMLVMAASPRKNGFVTKRVQYSAAVLRSNTNTNSDEESDSDNEKNVNVKNPYSQSAVVQECTQNVLNARKRKRNDPFHQHMVSQMSKLKFRNVFLPFSASHGSTSSLNIPENFESSENENSNVSGVSLKRPKKQRKG